MPDEIEIGGHTKHPVGKRLSNFYPGKLIFDGVTCGGFEGLVQSFKCPDPKRQREIASLSGLAAKRAGSEFDSWKESQVLQWSGVTYERTSRGYTLLIARAYDAKYEQVASFRKDLLALGDAQIWHSIGKPDMRATTLTEVEMMWNLERLRHRAFRDALAALMK